MTKEDIKKAAAEYAHGACRPLWRAGKEQVCMVDFIEGAKWRINSVWHDIEKLPDVGKLIIVDVASDYDLCYYEDCQVWKSVRKWAYIEDLIPNRED